MGIDAAHEGGAVRRTDRLSHVGRNVADRKADAAILRPVGRRAMRQQDVMQGRLARLQRCRHALGFVDVDGDLLTAAQEIMLVERVAMLELDAMRAWHELHAAVQKIGRREGQPHRHDVGRAQPPVGGVLVPRHEAGVGCLLDEEARAPAQEIGTEHVLDRVEDARMADQVVEPGEIEMRLVAPVALDRAAHLRFMYFKAPTQIARLRFRQDVDREVVTIVLVFFDSVGGQKFGHGLTRFDKRRYERPPASSVPPTRQTVKPIRPARPRATRPCECPRRIAAKPSLMRAIKRDLALLQSRCLAPKRRLVS